MTSTGSKMLVLHQNFPGQFVNLVTKLRTDHVLVAITDERNTRPRMVQTLYYKADRLKGRYPGLSGAFSMATDRGKLAADGMIHLRDRDFRPDIILGHSGWGETLFAKDVFPDAKLVIYTEYYYQALNLGFDPEFATPDDVKVLFSARTQNATNLLALMGADYAVTPTRWQLSRFPPELQSKIRLIHDGIKTDVACPKADAVFAPQTACRAFTRHDEVITFVNRNLEPYRGYHIFMRALPGILAARPKAHVVIVGGDETSYSPPPPSGWTWKDVFLDEVKDHLPMDRVHFVGKVPYSQFIALMQVSSAHVYLTYPFVLSWSMLEAMSAGAPVIASRTAPVEDVIEDGVNGRLFDFFDKGELTDLVIDILAHPQRFEAMRQRARDTIVQRYDIALCLDQWLAFLAEVSTGVGSAASCSR